MTTGSQCSSLSASPRIYTAGVTGDHQVVCWCVPARRCPQCAPNGPLLPKNASVFHLRNCTDAKREKHSSPETCCVRVDLSDRSAPPSERSIRDCEGRLSSLRAPPQWFQSMICGPPTVCPSQDGSGADLWGFCGQTVDGSSAGNEVSAPDVSMPRKAMSQWACCARHTLIGTITVNALRNGKRRMNVRKRQRRGY